MRGHDALLIHPARPAHIVMRPRHARHCYRPAPPGTSGVCDGADAEPGPGLRLRLRRLRCRHQLDVPDRRGRYRVSRVRLSGPKPQLERQLQRAGRQQLGQGARDPLLYRRAPIHVRSELGIPGRGAVLGPNLQDRHQFREPPARHRDDPMGRARRHSRQRHLHRVFGGFVDRRDLWSQAAERRFHLQPERRRSRQPDRQRQHRYLARRVSSRRADRRQHVELVRPGDARPAGLYPGPIPSGQRSGIPPSGLTTMAGRWAI